VRYGVEMREERGEQRGRISNKSRSGDSREKRRKQVSMKDLGWVSELDAELKEDRI